MKRDMKKPKKLTSNANRAGRLNPAERIIVMKNNLRANEIATELRNSGEWSLKLLAELCEIAGLKEEWLNSDGETFESVAYKAAEILGVDID